MYNYMRIALPSMGLLFLSSLSFLSFLCSSCSTPTESHIIDVADLPLKSTDMPGDGWAETPLRVHARYMLDHAESRKEKEARRGDYFFVNWYDASPTAHSELRFHYTQAATGSRVLTRRYVYKPSGAQAGRREAEFFFIGEENAKKGNILSWRVELLVDGKLKGSLQSFLWE